MAEPMRRNQCAKCPWRVDVDPNDITNGYSPEMHAALRGTIAKRDRYDFRMLRIMACHESPVGQEIPCVGWLVNQLGPGNNIALRMAVSAGRIAPPGETVGPQHERFEDTLPV